MEHDYKKYPELTNKQLQEIGFTAPIKQITENFEATVTKVHDGDTVTLRCSFRDIDFPLRLLDIDAPELNAGGGEARDWLKQKVEGQQVQIQIDKKNRVDKYGRLLGRLMYQGLNVAQEQIYLGLAKPFGRRYEGQFPNLEKEFNLSKWLSI